MAELRAVVYVRLSSYRGPADPTTSPERQQEACQSYADAQGWKVVDVVEDLDVSGSARGMRPDRPGLQRIRALWPRVDVVIFMKLDRIARNVADFHAFAEEAGEHGAALVSVRDGLDLTMPSGRFVATILAAFAELEADTIRDRTREGKRAARAAGRVAGGSTPFGYDAVPNPDGAGSVLQANEREAAALRGVVEHLAAGSTLARACRWLNEQGLPPRRSREWNRTSMIRALQVRHQADFSQRCSAEPSQQRCHRGRPTLPHRGGEPGAFCRGSWSATGAGSGSLSPGRAASSSTGALAVSRVSDARRRPRSRLTSWSSGSKLAG